MTGTDDQSLPAQLDAIRHRLDAGTEKMRMLELGHAELKAGQASIAAQVAVNTAITQDIRDIVTAGRIGSKLIKWAGAMALAGSAVWAAAYALLHGGRLPHQ